MFFHESGFEPFLEDGLFHGNMAKEPLVRNGVERSINSIPWSRTQINKIQQKLRLLTLVTRFLGAVSR